MAKKEITLYQNVDIYTEAARESALETLIERAEMGGENRRDFTESEIDDEIYFQNESEWDFFVDELERYFNGHELFVAVGTVGKWNGTFNGGFVFSDINEFFKQFGGYDYVEYTDCGGKLIATGYHHDGSNTVEIRPLTAKGIEYFYRHDSDFDERRLCSQLAARYSTNANYEKEMFGSPKTA